MKPKVELQHQIRHILDSSESKFADLELFTEESSPKCLLNAILHVRGIRSNYSGNEAHLICKIETLTFTKQVQCLCVTSQ